MTDEEHSDSRTTDSYTEDDYEEAEEPYDDEGTLDEEEREHPEEDYHNELKMLEDDASLSVEELRRRYYGDGLEDEEHSTDDAQSSSAHSEDTLQDAETEDANSISQLNDTEMSAGSSSGGKSKAKGESRGYFSEEEDNEEDDEYVPPDPWRKNVRQGPFYQATIPAFISPDVDYSSAERELLLWRPPAESQMESVESYLRNFYDMAFRSSASANAADLSRLSVATQQQQPLRDDESALKAFLDTGYDVDAAMAKYPFPAANAPQISIGPNPSKWTDTDCQLFEEGMRIHGKNFFIIQRSQVRIFCMFSYFYAALC
ncbi:unnamed protein product [Toxocara canis]|uniref:ELM2 domain-containing protein n=1 Tax=Toxocara canis TaxID=6265 RepID=A0A183UX06_TOXCA|nr:unnamed protein product [Toxocara canis]